jgi:hypothetical protein
MSTTMTTVTAAPVDSAYASATAGQSPGAIAAPAADDLVPISQGRGTLIIFITSGTGSVVTLTNVVAPPYGTGGDVTVTLSSTDLKTVFIRNDPVKRFDQTANPGYVKLTYSSTAAIAVYAVVIP